jgi:hypothetical protein
MVDAMGIARLLDSQHLTIPMASTELCSLLRPSDKMADRLEPIEKSGPLSECGSVSSLQLA